MQLAARGSRQCVGGKSATYGRSVVISDQVLELGSDEATIVLREAGGAGLTFPSALEANTLVSLVDEADMAEVWILTGSQWGPFRVQVTVLEGPPDQPHGQWEDVVEFSVGCERGIEVCEMVDGPVGSLVAAGGTYRVRVHARGRSDGRARDGEWDDEADGADEPAEHYLLQVWPAPASTPAVLRQDSALAQLELNPPPPDPVTPEEEAGLAASERILADLEGGPAARELSGRRGLAAVSGELPGTRRKVFPRVAWAVAWPLCRGGAIGDLAVGGPSHHDGTRPGRDSEYGHISATFQEINKPALIVKSWNWHLPLHGVAVYGEAPPFLDPYSTIRLELTDTTGPSGDKMTLVNIEQSDLPIEWVDDFRALWRWNLHLLAR